MAAMGTFDNMLDRIAQLAWPRAAAVRSSAAPTPLSFYNLIARLCLFACSFETLERRNVLTFVDSETVQAIASYTFSAPLRLKPAGRSEIRARFNELVEQYVVIHRSSALPAPVHYRTQGPRGVHRMVSLLECRAEARRATRRSCKTTVSGCWYVDAYLACGHTLRSESLVSAPKGQAVDWSIVIFVFGHIPELWGLGTPDGSGPSGAEPSSASVHSMAKTLEIPSTGPLDEREETSAIPDAEPMVVDPEASGPAPSVSHLRDSDPTRGICRDDHPGSCHSLPSLRFGATNAYDPDAPRGGAQTADSIAGISGVAPAVSQQAQMDVDPINLSAQSKPVITFLQDPDLVALLSAFGFATHLPGSELSTLLRAALHSKKEPAAMDPLELVEARMKKLARLHELKEVNGEFVGTFWALARHMKQWHSWGLEVRYFHECCRGASLSPDILSSQDELFTYVTGFTVLAVHLQQQQEDFHPPGR